MPVREEVTAAVGPARELFASTPLAKFIEERHKDLLTVDEAATVGDALKLLSANKILSAPVTAGDAKQANGAAQAKAYYSGCISLADILKGLVKQVEARRILHGTTWDEKVASVKEADLIEIGRELLARPVSHFCHAGSLLLEAEEGVNLAEVLESGFNIHDSHPHHRIYVCHEALKPHDHAAGKTHSAAGWRATDVISQTDLLAFLQANAAAFPALAGTTLEALGLTATGVCTTGGNTTTALDAFHKMLVDHHSAIGLLDEATGRLVGNLSITDLRGLGSGPESFAALAKPALEFVKPTARPIVTLPPTATLGQLLETLSANRLRRVYVVAQEDGAEKLDGIVSITDVLRIVANPPIEEEGGERDDDEEEMNGEADEEEQA
ncbi:hypothetical protein DFJ74DRAFT_671299 [Hyaloraphidium curvatum]|nr:hypothetical protein DFJ74DRAFT_671299 [Hyaloraphidium curvatum]